MNMVTILRVVGASIAASLAVTQALAQAEIPSEWVLCNNEDRAYPPELVIDGRTDAVGGDGRAVTSALAAQRTGAPLSVSLQESELLVDVGAQPQAPRCDVLLVAYLRHAVSAIGRGENAGRNLQEYNIVREVRPLGTWQGELKAFHVPLAALPRDATDVAVLIQPLGQGPMVGAAAHALR